MDPVDVEAALRSLIWEWDPIGVADIEPAPTDEYDCLLGPLMSKLSRGAGRPEVSEYLWQELEDHFGLDPAELAVDGMANRLVAWWEAVAPAPLSSAATGR